MKTEDCYLNHVVNGRSWRPGTPGGVFESGVVDPRLARIRGTPSLRPVKSRLAERQHSKVVQWSCVPSKKKYGLCQVTVNSSLISLQVSVVGHIYYVFSLMRRQISRDDVG